MRAPVGAQCAQAVHERRRQHEGDEHPDRRVEAVHPLVHLVPVLRQLEARVGERPAPGERAREGEPHEGPELHPRDPRRERDEGAHDGEETRPEDRRPAPAREPAPGEPQLAVAARGGGEWGAEPAGLEARLGLLDPTALVARSMIGSGIFIVSADIARRLPAPGWLLAVWAIAGALTVTGALSYGHLAAAMPRAGG